MIAPLSASDQRGGAGGASAIPTMVVAETLLGEGVPFGLAEPMALRGGARLSGPVARTRIACEWNTELLDCIEAAGRQQFAAGRDWFHMDALMLAGPAGAGRTHLARRLAQEAGVPHFPLDMGVHPFGRRAVGPTLAVPSPLSSMLAMSGCANPVIDVTGIAAAGADALGRLAVAMDPMRGRLDDEVLGVTLDLSEATWLVQLPPDMDPPAALTDVARAVTLAKPVEPHWEQLAWIEALIEVAADRGQLGSCGALADGMADVAAGMCLTGASDAAERHRAAVDLFNKVYGAP